MSSSGETITTHMEELKCAYTSDIQYILIQYYAAIYGWWDHEYSDDWTTFVVDSDAESWTANNVTIKFDCYRGSGSYYITARGLDGDNDASDSVELGREWLPCGD